MCMSYVLYCIVLYSLYIYFAIITNVAHGCQSHRYINSTSSILFPTLHTKSSFSRSCVCYFHTMSTHTQHIIPENEATILTYMSLSLNLSVNTNIHSKSKSSLQTFGFSLRQWAYNTHTTKMHNSSFHGVCQCEWALEWKWAISCQHTIHLYVYTDTHVVQTYIAVCVLCCWWFFCILPSHAHGKWRWYTLCCVG